MNLTHETSASLFKKALRVLPGAVNSPVRAFGAVGGNPPFIDHARGSYLYDVDGHRYIDYVMSWGPLIHGHAPRELTTAISRAARRGTSFGAPTALEIELGGLVKNCIRSIERVRFVNSGTEATISAVRLARAATGRNKIIKFSGCYHGHGDPFLVQAGSGATTLGVPTSPGVSRATATETLIANYNDVESVSRLFRSHRNSIAAVIVEPIAGNMGVVTPNKQFLPGLRKLCNRHGALLIFDEVISGFRVSKGGAQSVFGVQPDLTCLGKIIGGGLPVGAYGGKAELMDQISPAGPVYQAGTLSGNPLAMTAGIWTLNHLSAPLYRRLEKLCNRLANGLRKSALENNIPLQVNVAGSVLTPFFSQHPIMDYGSATNADTESYASFFHGMLRRGIYPPPSQFEGWFLSAAHNEKDVDRTIAAAKQTLSTM